MCSLSLPSLPLLPFSFLNPSQAPLAKYVAMHEISDLRRCVCKVFGSSLCVRHPVCDVRVAFDNGVMCLSCDSHLCHSDLSVTHVYVINVSCLLSCGGVL